MLSKKRAFLVIVIFYNNLRAIPRHGEEHDVRFFDTSRFGIGNAGECRPEHTGFQSHSPGAWRRFS
jgi:hypothetical protein